ncbi:LppX_LprAFG lipoprotein [Aeromicrobium ginsengisoli]|uniref:LppX_LprAFG lipoprotein n=1 Tax=Aeromicrobium ginsengisoli TaxID=363867 RepID=A0A5M4FIQ1_9ACTN|nr:LppX_LprAFG lipoprotein [Aeromicrobium ginsengisoli]KAA1399633.1 LppX_LprAFG lipoprotein [Aeromicrobium ginsengisoli]
MRTRHLILTLAASALVVSGCTGSSGDDGGTKGDPAKLQARLTEAKTALDDAETVTISLATTKLPSGVTGLLSAKGQGNHSPAFKGKVKVVTGGASLDADVIAADGKVWAKTGFSPTFLTINPASLKAPDPAGLLAPDTGISQILAKTQKLSEGDKSRDGKDVLTTITGTLPGSLVRDIIPSAAQDKSFAVTYRLDDDNVLRDASLKGPFYPNGGDVTYTVRLTTSDTAITIEPPTPAGR